MTAYDLIVVGAGSGNTIVDRAFDDWRVAIVESGPLGGTCLNAGCIPSKMYVVAAERADEAAHNEAFGITTEFAGADWPAIRDRIFARTDRVADDGRRYREQQANVDLLRGTARFVGPRRLAVTTDEGTVEIEGEQIVLATGSRPVLPPIEGLDAVRVHTSDTIMHLPDLPRRLGIIGGGYVGCEFAHVFAALGSHVVQIESTSRLLGNQDHEIAELFTAAAREWWEVRVDAEVQRVSTTSDDAIELHLDDGTIVVVDELLVAVGRRPNGDRLDLERAGVRADDHDLIEVDVHQRTSAPGIWALGDASSPVPLKHVANQDARVVRHNLQHPDRLVASDHRAIPQAVFSRVQVASVGLTEEQAREQDIDLAIGRSGYASTAHGWALEEDAEDHHGAKLLADRATGLLVGAHLFGPQASSLIQPLIQAMSFDQPVAGLARGQYWIHPALIEVVENALLALEKELAT